MDFKFIDVILNPKENKVKKYFQAYGALPGWEIPFGPRKESAW
jgi:hypothetical protein